MENKEYGGVKARIGAIGRVKAPNIKKIIGDMVVAHEGEQAMEVVFGSSDRDAVPIKEERLVAKISRLSQDLGIELGKLAAEAESLADAEKGSGTLSKVMQPWVESNTPASVFHDAERLAFSNERVIDTLTRHLVEHIVVRGELRDIAETARQAAADSLRELPDPFVDFVNRLEAYGVTTHHVRALSRKRYAEIVAMIQKTDPVSVENAMPDSLPQCSWTDDASPSSPPSAAPDADRPSATPLEQADAGSAASSMESEGAAGEMELPRVEVTEPLADGQLAVSPNATSVTASEDQSDVEAASAANAASATPIDPEDGEEVSPSNESAGILIPAPDELVFRGPHAMWNEIELGYTGYTDSMAPPRRDEDYVSFNGHLPPVRSMLDVVMREPNETAVARIALEQGDPNLACRFIQIFTHHAGIILREEELRVWLFLWYEIHMPKPSHRMGGAGFFDGVQMPGPSYRASCRLLTATNQTDLRDKASLAQLMGPATFKVPMRKFI